MTPERLLRIQTTLNQRQPDLTVLTDEVYKPHNLAAIARTCDAVGIPEVHCVWPHDHFRLKTASLAGSHDWIEVHTHPDIETAILGFQQQGYTVCAAHLTDKAMDYREYDFTQPTVLVMGTEREGISNSASELADHHLMIPMQGMVESFNVSVAAAIMLNEAQYQRTRAGLYSTRRLPDERYQRLLFEWCHPIETRLCKQYELPYPDLREDGEIANPQAFSIAVNKAASARQATRKK